LSKYIFIIYFPTLTINWAKIWVWNL